MYPQLIISFLYFADENEVIMASKRFVIMDSNGKLIFSTSPTETSMSSKKMKVSEIGGIQFSSRWFSVGRSDYNGA